MSAAIDVTNGELKLLNNPINICILVEDVSVPSAIWGVENNENRLRLAHENLKARSGRIRHLDILNNNGWEISQAREFFDQVRVYDTNLPQYLDTNMERYTRKFELALGKSETRNLDRKLFQNHFYKTAFKISELECSDATVEIAKNNSLKYTLLFPENKMLMISSSVNNETDEIVFSYFINRELISTNAMELTGFIEGFKKFLKS
ncbi:hypothetical protein [Chitinophaga sp. Cy-1792]|uniref:hypothetical protein n=1 Tax=Chitinophaga sp. Cy-1792 TaxID=2608339 RepID=UPI0014235A6F|nr:hypothetical protein [Chitinophaga sp. Cy-1792]NIG52511.1 hypothetical protein [Chitinophaga sp. Cy-1792]